VTTERQRWLEETLATVPERESTLLAVLALSEPIDGHRLANLADAAGLRPKGQQRVTPRGLRLSLDLLVSRGLAHPSVDVCRCARFVGPPVLRRAARLGTLDALANKLGNGSGWDRSTFAHREEQYRMRARLAITRHETNAVDQLDRLADGLSHVAAVDDNVLTPAFLEPFDAEWLARMPAANRGRILGPWLARREAGGGELGELATYLSDHIDFLSSTAEALVSFAGIALMRGEMSLVLRVAEGLGPGPSAARARGAHAVATGHCDEALNLFAADKRLCSDFPAVLQVLALLGRGTASDVDLAQRTTSKGARARGPFVKTFLALGPLVAAVANPSHLRAPYPSAFVADPTDCFAPLIQLIFALWCNTRDGFVRSATADGMAALQRLEPTGRGWLIEQYQQTLLALSKTPHGKTRSEPWEDLRTAPRPVYPSLKDLRPVKAPWELTLEGLARLADDEASVGVASVSTDERLAFRVDPIGLGIEPFLQKRRAGRWTTGRKLAVKHLLPEGILKDLSREDARVAAFARQQRQVQVSGYPTVAYFIDSAAWTALIGHPRVYVGDSEQPVEVVKGEVELVAHADETGILVTVSPPSITDELFVRSEPARLSVFQLTAPQRQLVGLVGDGLSIRFGTIPSHGDAQTTRAPRARAGE
jgi:hypothetical protein